MPGPARVELPLLRWGATFLTGAEAPVEGDVCRLIFTDLSAERAAQEELLRINQTLERQMEDNGSGSSLPSATGTFWLALLKAAAET